MNDMYAIVSGIKDSVTLHQFSGCDYRPRRQVVHDLRHTHASFLLKIEINPKVAAERLGMTPAMFNERYSHLLPTMQDEAVDRIEAELKKHSEKSLEPTNV